jgi:hypothetical protein
MFKAHSFLRVILIQDTFIMNNVRHRKKLIHSLQQVESTIKEHEQLKSYSIRVKEFLINRALAYPYIIRHIRECMFNLGVYVMLIFIYALC